MLKQINYNATQSFSLPKAQAKGTNNVLRIAVKRKKSLGLKERGFWVAATLPKQVMLSHKPANFASRRGVQP
jgi:hypothetical protein